MKKTFIILTIATVLATGLIACNDENAPVLREAEDESSIVNSGGDIPIGGPRVESGDEILVEGETPPPARDDNSSGERTNIDRERNGGSQQGSGSGSGSSSIGEKVRIQNISGNTLGKWVYGKEHTREVQVISDDEVSISAEGLPEGLTGEQAGKKLTIKGSPMKLGDFSVKITAVSTSDATNRAEKTVSMKVVEKLALNAYKLQAKEDSGWEWAMIDDRNGIQIPPGGVIRLEVRTLVEDAGDADDDPEDSTKDGISNYSWLINDENCAVDPCEKDGLILQKAYPFEESKSAETSKKESVRYLIAGENFIGETINLVNLKVQNENGDEDSITLSSIVFEKDPCTTPLALQVPNIEHLLIKFNKVFISSPCFVISGGKAPYKWTVTDNPNPSVIFSSSTGESETTNIAVQSKFKPPSVSLKELIEGKKFVSKIQISDSCNPKTRVEGTYTINLKNTNPQIPKVSELKIKITFTELNDTSSDGEYDVDTTDLRVHLLGMAGTNRVDYGHAYYDLDSCGDNGNLSDCHDSRKFRQNLPTNGKVEDFVPNAKMTDVKGIHFKFHEDYCFTCGWLDAKIKEFEIYSGEPDNKVWIAKSTESFGKTDISRVKKPWYKPDGTKDWIRYYRTTNMIGYDKTTNDMRTIWRTAGVK